MLEMTDLVMRLPQFSKRVMKVRWGNVKCYLVDLALRNALEEGDTWRSRSNTGGRSTTFGGLHLFLEQFPKSFGLVASMNSHELQQERLASVPLHQLLFGLAQE